MSQIRPVNTWMVVVFVYTKMLPSNGHERGMEMRWRCICCPIYISGMYVARFMLRAGCVKVDASPHVDGVEKRHWPKKRSPPHLLRRTLHTARTTGQSLLSCSDCCLFVASPCRASTCCPCFVFRNNVFDTLSMHFFSERRRYEARPSGMSFLVPSHAS